MKKAICTLALALSCVALGLEARAQSPQVYALGSLFQSDDATLMFNYNAIESNQPVYQVYDVDLIADYYENGNYLGGFQSTGVNFAEIPVSIPALPYNFYQQLSYYSLRPVDICGGFIDWFGFSACYGGNYFLPFTFNGGCPILCINFGAILLGAFALEVEMLPTLTLNSVTASPTTFGPGQNSKTTVTARVSASTGVPASTRVVLRTSPFEASVPLTLATSPADISAENTRINAQESKDFSFDASVINLPSGTVFPITLKIRVTIEPDALSNGRFMIVGSPADSPMLTVQ